MVQTEISTLPIHNAGQTKAASFSERVHRRRLPYKIKQEHCLHCGYCYESCPVKAIEHRKAN
ncbi:MAG: 4Fe-4S binding protein [Ruminococcus sp.]|nr:4Fe-4S binding protein [Ruminococcus sp.]